MRSNVGGVAGRSQPRVWGGSALPRTVSRIDPQKDANYSSGEARDRPKCSVMCWASNYMFISELLGPGMGSLGPLWYVWSRTTKSSRMTCLVFFWK